MTKVLLGFQLVTASFVHLICCGLPLLLSISGGLSIFIALHAYAPLLLCCQLIIFGVTFYQVYKPAGKASKVQRTGFWFISLVSIVFYFYPPVHWFKSEETRLKEAQIQRFFKHKPQ